MEPVKEEQHAEGHKRGGSRPLGLKYPRVVYDNGIQLRISRIAELSRDSGPQPYIDLNDLNMEGSDEVIPLTRGEALMLMESLARYVRFEEKTNENGNENS